MSKICKIRKRWRWLWSLCSAQRRVSIASVSLFLCLRLFWFSVAFVSFLLIAKQHCSYFNCVLLIYLKVGKYDQQYIMYW